MRVENVNTFKLRFHSILTGYDVDFLCRIKSSATWHRSPILHNAPNLHPIMLIVWCEPEFVSHVCFTVCGIFTVSLCLERKLF